jgi:hypothetical protein
LAHDCPTDSSATTAAAPLERQGRWSLIWLSQSSKLTCNRLMSRGRKGLLWATVLRLCSETFTSPGKHVGAREQWPLDYPRAFLALDDRHEVAEGCVVNEAPNFREDAHLEALLRGRSDLFDRSETRKS